MLHLVNIHDLAPLDILGAQSSNRHGCGLKVFLYSPGGYRDFLKRQPARLTLAFILLRVNGQRENAAARQ